MLLHYKKYPVGNYTVQQEIKNVIGLMSNLLKLNGISLTHEMEALLSFFISWELKNNILFIYYIKYIFITYKYIFKYVSNYMFKCN